MEHVHCAECGTITIFDEANLNTPRFSLPGPMGQSTCNDSSNQARVPKRAGSIFL